MKIISNIHTNIAGQELHPGDIATISTKHFNAYTMSGGKKRKGLPHLQKVDKSGKVIK